MGNFSGKIKESVKIVKEYVDNFNHYDRDLQLVILTTGVKVFINDPVDDSYIQTLLSISTNNSENIEVRERGNFYWRLLSSNKIPLIKNMLFV